jgi:hypothetical protein
MKTTREEGFILTMVILFLGLMSIVLLFLNEGVQTTLSQADRMYLAAVEQNLAASGAAWAASQLSADHPIPADRALDLDSKAFGDHPCGLSVRLAKRSDSRSEVVVSTTCAKSRWEFSRSRTYAIPTP